MIVGLPGLLMALWVSTLREPVRGISEGMVSDQGEVRPLLVFWESLRSVLPVFSILEMRRAGAGSRPMLVNAVALAVITGAALALIALLGTPAQWIALGIGLYAAFSWAQNLALSDAPAFALIFRSRALVYACAGFSLLAFSAYGISAFTPPFFMRVHGVSATEVGTVIGVTAAVAGFIGVALGGLLSDRLRPTVRCARLYIGLVVTVAPVPFAIWMLATGSTTTAYVLNFVVSVGAGMWIGPAAASVQDLVLPRMRAVASASYILVITFVGLALGPYTVGRISVATGDLPFAMMLAFSANAGAFVFLLLATRHLPRDETTREERAIAAGEVL